MTGIVQMQKGEKMKDPIERQTAIDALRDEFKRIPTIAIRAMEVIKALSSAQTASTGYAMTDGADFGITVLSRWSGAVMRKGELMSDELFTLTLNSPITEEQWDMITDVDFDNTNEITFHTKHGKEVKFVKASAQPEIIHCPDCKYGVHSGCGDRYICTVNYELRMEHDSTFYCGYGKRRENE